MNSPPFAGASPGLRLGLLLCLDSVDDDLLTDKDDDALLIDDDCLLNDTRFIDCSSVSRSTFRPRKISSTNSPGIGSPLIHVSASTFDPKSSRAVSCSNSSPHGVCATVVLHDIDKCKTRARALTMRSVERAEPHP